MYISSPTRPNPYKILFQLPDRRTLLLFTLNQEDQDRKKRGKIKKKKKGTKIFLPIMPWTIGTFKTLART